MKKRGSITLYLLLFLSVFILLIGAAFYSLRYRGARAVVKTAARQSMYDLFSRYDAELLASYDLLFLDGGFQTDSFHPEYILTCVKKNAGVCWGKGSLTTNIWGLSDCTPALNGYVLATDQKGEAFYQEALLWSKQNLASSAVKTLKEQISESKKQEQKGENDGDVEKACDDYKKAVEKAQEGESQEAASGDGEVESADSRNASSAAVSEAPDKNPIEVIKKLQKKGILYLVLPAGKNISEKSVKKTALLSGRTRMAGTGLQLKTSSHAATNHLLYAGYLKNHLSCFTKEDTNAALSWQMEYVIGGQNSDAKNLKKVVTALLVMREGANLISLNKDGKKLAEVHAMAAAISSAMLVPVAEDLVAKALKVCWAYGESLTDVRTLLAGGKVPLVKSSSDWQVSLKNLADLGAKNTQKKAGSKKGLDYAGYLNILMGTKQDATILKRGMDMVELGMQGQKNSSHFRMDHCIYGAEIELYALVDQSLSITASEYRSYEN